MGRKKAGSKARPATSRPRKGKYRSIRYDAYDDPAADGTRSADPEAPPAILLRMLTVEEALHRLASQLQGYAARGERQVLVVHGKGQNSPGGKSVLGPAVRKWCDSNQQLVASWRQAPPRWGGEGAVVLVLQETGDKQS